MIQKIKTSKFSKVIASYLAIQLIVQMTQPMNLWALTSGPSQPEFNSFTPIGTSDMVNLSSGNFNYNIPVMDVGGYPLNLSYDAGVTMDQEASWAGLGWNLNVGQINRQVRGLPDDFKGDEMVYENNMKDNVTVGVTAELDLQVFGFEAGDFVGGGKSDGSVSAGINMQYNNYTGYSFKPSFGLSFDLSDNITVGMDVQTSAIDGVTISPTVNAKTGNKFFKETGVTGALNAGISYNSNRGLSNFSLSSSLSKPFKVGEADYTTKDGARTRDVNKNFGLGGYGSVSFANTTLTPRKRTAFKDINGTVAVSVGTSLWGIDGEIEVSAMGSVQKVKDPLKTEKAYGYEFTGYATPDDVLDYNRENDQLISKTTLALPTTNYTYDLYSVNGQGVGGMFRPFRSQVGQINDELVQDDSDSFQLGVEVEATTSIHAGVNFVAAPSNSRTGIWNTKALKNFTQKREDVKEADEKIDYEPVYFKYVGEPRVDKDYELFESLGGYNPIALEIGGANSSFNKQAENQFTIKKYDADGVPFYPSTTNEGRLNPISGKFKREYREVRNQNVQKFTVSELEALYPESEYHQGLLNSYAKAHHTAEIRVLKSDGSTYVFGETAYNVNKEEVTFASNSTNFDCATGIINYATGEDTRNNRSGIDNFYNNVVTPSYAHTYLISSILSSDYEDLKGDGPTDDDAGAYTLFKYKQLSNNFNWRIPYGSMEASYNAGLNTHPNDQKGSYIYGNKEVKYVDKIITKTHVAIFKFSPRKDALGAAGRQGGIPSSGQELMKIDQIHLYSKPEAEAANLLDDDETNDLPLTSIKTAHFTYDYSLCKELPNTKDRILNDNEMPFVDEDGNVNNSGKLTLKKVHFTYRGSEMGKYTPYTFNYDGLNPDYNLKSYDIWGNYKPNNEGGCHAQQDPITAPEYPFVQQEDKNIQDEYATAWSLSAIDLPSGGRIEVTYESDDYTHVQDRDAMQMFKVVGAGVSDRPTNPEDEQRLYKASNFNDADYLYVKLPEETHNITREEFIDKYLKAGIDKPIYFRFLMNMTKEGALSGSSNDFDYVTGYFEIDEENGTKPISVFNTNGDISSVYASIPMKTSDIEGGAFGGSKQVNPISKAGWYFGRQHLNGWVYGLQPDAQTQNMKDIAQDVVNSFGAIKDIFTGPNKKLRSNQYLCAQRFISDKSWIRLSSPKPKLGGGCRVKQLIMKDQWAQMINEPSSERTDKEYGQTYDYTLANGTSSGVATYEPNMSKENPFVEPFYNVGERLIAPKEVSYVEKPFGEQFFPSASVTYSRVTVSNLVRDDIDKHATGKVVTEHYTSKDFPTKVDHTDIDGPDNFASNQGQFLQNIVKGLLGAPVEVKNEYTLSQGFVVHTNDMNGKMRMQKVFAENTDEPISSVEYKYSTESNDASLLNNKLPTIERDGTVHYDRQIGVDYDVVTDFRESYSESKTTGFNGNILTLLIGPIPVIVPTAIPSRSKIENIAHSAIVTKVIHTTAQMKEKIATDLGAKVSTVYEAWDAETGQVLLTRTINEYNDEYFNFNFPAYWSYEGMGQASQNIGIEGSLTKSGSRYTIDGGSTEQYLYVGDELMVQSQDGVEKLWVVEVGSSGIKLMNIAGTIITNLQGDINFKIIRSGYRNQQMANMSSITLMNNPLPENTGAGLYSLDSNTFVQAANGATADNLRIVNASAVEYDDFWNCQCENDLPVLPRSVESSADLKDTPIENFPFNPYLYNVKGEWRAIKSYAYLTERVAITNGISNKVNLRKEGYFKEFTPFYNLISNSWQRTTTTDADIEQEQKWTFASEVTQYSPYGAELENKDALDRFSSAQYGYSYTLPVGVVSNSKYQDMGVDNFEDYEYNSEGINTLNGHFNFKETVDDASDTGMISSKRSHTGRNSLVLRQGDDIHLERQLLGEFPEDMDFDKDSIPNADDNCIYTFNPLQEDYDDDGVGDVCDDEYLPKISGVETLRIRCRSKQAKFYVTGKANADIELALITDFRGAEGWRKTVINDTRLSESRYQTISYNLGPSGIKEFKLEVFFRDRKGGEGRNRVLVKLVRKDGGFVSNDDNEIVVIELYAGKCSGTKREKGLF